ncbi:MAG: hypothetical protein H0X30_23270 [Anaerolineae bacterium]|nr:hypothetical protein [Anaerolineae bacterium]
MNFRQIFSESFKADKNLLNLHGVLVKMRSEGIDKETLISELKAYHDELEDEDDQDRILEAI